MQKIIKVLKDVLVTKNQLDRYFDGSVPVDLWRAFNARPE